MSDTVHNPSESVSSIRGVRVFFGSRAFCSFCILANCDLADRNFVGVGFAESSDVVLAPLPLIAGFLPFAAPFLAAAVFLGGIVAQEYDEGWT